MHFLQKPQDSCSLENWWSHHPATVSDHAGQDICSHSQHMAHAWQAGFSPCLWAGNIKKGKVLAPLCTQESWCAPGESGLSRKKGTCHSLVLTGQTQPWKCQCFWSCCTYQGERQARVKLWNPLNMDVITQAAWQLNITNSRINSRDELQAPRIQNQ